MNRFLKQMARLWGALAVLAASSAQALSLPLPPLARVVSVDAHGDSWRQSGEISGSVAGVHGDFMAAMAGNGWILQKTIVLGRTPQHSELMMWKKGSTKILLMIWEKCAGRCGFSWGVET
jgi:hypothetical protein